MPTDKYVLLKQSVWATLKGLVTLQIASIVNQITNGTVNAANQLNTARTIDGISFNGTSNITRFAVCDTAAATAAKEASLTGFTLASGSSFKIKFTYTNTAASPTINVNSTGAISLTYAGAALDPGMLEAGMVFEFLYNGTTYDLVGAPAKDVFTASTAQDAGEDGLVPGPAANVGSGYYLQANGSWAIPPDTTYSTFTASTNVSAGESGLVPAPAIGDGATKYLDASGSWSIPYGVFTAATAQLNGTNGLVPGPTAGDDATKYLDASGTWSVPYHIFTPVDVTGEEDGTFGLVPAPTYSPTDTRQSTKFLNAEGNWVHMGDIAGSLNDDTYYHQVNTAYPVGATVHVPEYNNFFVLQAMTEGVTSSTRPDFDADLPTTDLPSA